MAVTGGISVSQAAEIEAAICEILKDAVAGGDVVTLRGFGTFRRGRLAGQAWDPKRRKMVKRDRFRPQFKGKPIESPQKNAKSTKEKALPQRG